MLIIHTLKWGFEVFSLSLLSFLFLSVPLLPRFPFSFGLITLDLMKYRKPF